MQPRRPRPTAVAVTMAVTALLLAVMTGCAGGTPSPMPNEGGATPLRGDDRHTDPWLARSYAGDTPARPLPPDLEWLNVEYPLSLEQLKGKIVLLDFWTYGCINCIHNLPELKELQQKYDDSLVIIGVHSAKFENEGRSENLRRTISRYEIPYPVINDRDRSLMEEWNVRAWPTLVLIDPAGNVAGRETGEGFYQKFNRAILGLIQEFDERGELDRSPTDFTPSRDGLSETVLSFPSKVLGDPDRKRIFVADTGNHRILEINADNGAVRRVIGAGSAGFTDGNFREAQLSKPRGMALTPDGTILYVADTANHAVRRVDLRGEGVDTIAGTGIKPYGYPPRPGPLPTQGLRSPWDLLLDDDMLYVAMAGSHQIWRIDLKRRVAEYAAGNGREQVVDGPAFRARLAQPSGLALLDRRLYFADSESSFLRRLSLPGAPYAGAPPPQAGTGAHSRPDAKAQAFEGLVETVAGSGNGLFDFGDVDGTGPEVKLQHPLGVAADPAREYVYLADSYNHKIKRFDPETREVVSLFGGDAGWADGAAPRFFEPGGLDLHGDTLLVADTNNHAVRMIDLASGITDTLVVHSVPREPADLATLQTPPVRLAPGSRELSVDIALPAGFKVNDDAPSGVTLKELPTFLETERRQVQSPGGEFPIRFALEAREGSGTARLRLSLVYCREGNEGVCFFETVDLLVPIEIVVDAATTAGVRHELVHREP